MSKNLRNICQEKNRKGETKENRNGERRQAVRKKTKKRKKFMIHFIIFANLIIFCKF